LLRERLPCSENFWRYRRNYEKLLDAEEGKGEKSGSPKMEKKNATLASPKIMSKFSPVTGYIARSPGAQAESRTLKTAGGIVSHRS
jgi:hypothetical protein